MKLENQPIKQNEKNSNLIFWIAPILWILGWVATCQVCTLDFAAKFGISGYIQPFKIFDWFYLAELYEDEYVWSWYKSIISIQIPITLILAITLYIKRTKITALKTLHGSAHWATEKEIKRADLFNNKGVFVGAWRDPKGNFHYLRHNGPEHILCIAPTRSGKGVGLVNPTLLTWKESTFITDLKGELWALTSGWRSTEGGNKCIRFEPAKQRVCVNAAKNEFNVARWNPLDEIRAEGSLEYYFDQKDKKLKTRICEGANEIADVQNICTLIVDPDGKGLEDHWAKTAFALLVGAVIHLKHNLPNNCNLQTLDLMLTGQINFEEVRKNKGKLVEFSGEENSGGIKDLWVDMKNGLDCNSQPYKANKAVITAGADMYDRPDEEAGSVLSTAKSFLSLYRDPIVAENTSQSDFRIKQLMNLDDPVSLYVITQPTDKGRLKPLVRLLTNLVIRLLADDMQFKKGRSTQGYAHRLLLMLDEFPSLGKLDIMQESLAFIAGYGMKAYLITQDMSQLFNAYGKDESISSNCHIHIWYAPLKVDTAEIMSKKIGTATVVKKNVSISGSGLKKSRSESWNEVARPLLNADECMHLPAPIKENGDIKKAGDMVITLAGSSPIYGVQGLYFKNKTLLKRAQIDSPSATAILISDKLRTSEGITENQLKEALQFND